MTKAVVDRFARRWSVGLLTCGALAIVLLFAGSSAAQDEIDPWARLEALRDRLEGEDVRADFVQTFLPAGFSAGDEESGILYLAIPECLRWDYHQPYPKTYLVCGQEVFTWNEGETQGRRFLLESANEPGLDFLRLRIESLKARYSTESELLEESRLKIVFTPLEPGHTLEKASVVLDLETGLLVHLTYEDLEGNRTRFDLSSYRPIAGAAPFDQPAELEWLEQ